VTDPAADRQAAASDPPAELAARFIDFGDGEAVGFGDADDMLAIADWLERRYPEGHAGSAGTEITGER
jgi:hypothetical protein